ncbi:MAG TPA: hypothetical protein VEP89_11130, partial [Draconibacterium sp.]|nr:hypothetical protein [Draconibacterium sp.]
MLVAFVMLLGAGFIMLQYSWVQTRITRIVAKSLSKDLETNITIGKVDIGFFNHLKLEDVLIEDQAGDTLIYTQHISTRIDTLKLRKKQIVLNNLSFGNNKIYLSKDTAQVFNFGFLFKNMGPGNDSLNIWTFACKSFEFGDVLIRYSNSSTKNPTTVEARDLNLTVSNFYSYKDSLSFNMDDFSVNDGKGFLLKHASGHVANVGKSLNIQNLNIQSSGSELNNTDMDFQFYTASDSMNRTFDMDIDIGNSEIALRELGMFVPDIRGMNEKIKLSGNIYGSINDLKGKDISLETGNETYAQLDFYVNDLLNPENMYLFLDLKQSTTSFEDISNIRLPNIAKQSYIRFPESFYEAGQLRFKGNFSGFLTDFVTFGTLESEMGSLTTDILVMPEKEGQIYYRGNIATTNFQLGELFKQQELGAITLSGSADGQYNKKTQSVSGLFKGAIDSVEIHNYNYKNLAFDGILREKMFDGLLEIQDPNLDFTFIGEFDLNSDVPMFDFSLNLRHAYPGKLNLTKNFPATNLAFQMQANFTGDRIDNISGGISVKEGFYGNRNGQINLEGIEFKAYPENGKNILLLQSDFLDANISGVYHFKDLKNEFYQLVNYYLPAADLKFKTQTSRKNIFDYAINVKEVNPLVDIF